MKMVFQEYIFKKAIEKYSAQGDVKTFLETVKDREYVFDAAVVLAGGIKENGTPPKWVKERLDLAAKLLDMGKIKYIITPSRGTVYKPPVMVNGLVKDEGMAGAEYLMSEKGVNQKKILTQTASADTLGEAYFTRTSITDPLNLKYLLMITSTFHKRVDEMTRWVYTLPKSPIEKNVNYVYTQYVKSSGVGFRAFCSRLKKEKKDLDILHEMQEKINTLKGLSEYIFFEHGAYSVDRSIRQIINNAKGTY
jgi:hypothetical protein